MSKQNKGTGTRFKFSLGRIIVTKQAASVFKKSPVEFFRVLVAHGTGKWGVEGNEADDFDRKLNTQNRQTAKLYNSYPKVVSRHHVLGKEIRVMSINNRTVIMLGDKEMRKWLLKQEYHSHG